MPYWTALKEYAVSAGNLVRVLTTNLGNDRSRWGKDPKFLNVKPYLREWWLEVQWKKIQKEKAFKVLKCSEEQLVPTMKGHVHSMYKGIGTKRPRSLQIEAQNKTMH